MLDRLSREGKQSKHKVISFTCRANICADGSPNAYNSLNTGIDNNANGGISDNMIKKGDFRKRDKKDKIVKDNKGNVETAYGIVVDANTGVAAIQPVKSVDNADKYISPTSMHTKPNSSFVLKDQSSYVNSEEINYIVLPGNFINNLPKDVNLKFGDLVQVFNKNNGKFAFAIYAENGPSGKIGEISVALAKALGIPSSPKNGGTSKLALDITIYTGTGKGQGDGASTSQDEINKRNNDY